MKLLVSKENRQKAQLVTLHHSQLQHDFVNGKIEDGLFLVPKDDISNDADPEDYECCAIDVENADGETIDTYLYRSEDEYEDDLNDLHIHPHLVYKHHENFLADYGIDSLESAILQCDAVFTNEMSEHQIVEIAEAVRAYCRGIAEDLEGIFPEEAGDEELMIVQLNQI